MTKPIVFVCTGNTCRSPLAESYAKSTYENHTFSSRGIMVTETMTNPSSQQIIDEEKLSQPDAPQQISDEDAKNSILLTMTKGHQDLLKELYPDSEVYLLSEYADGSAMDIIDPVGGSYEDYREVYAQMKSFIDKLFK
ncbi:arsenate reductase/protein-tyrosine-phosphatase family protein [Lacicoccus qingdaonensis]|nr:low molecular weight phosphatase family protein [Salinicoccus qingdaonensis]